MESEQTAPAPSPDPPVSVSEAATSFDEAIQASLAAVAKSEAHDPSPEPSEPVDGSELPVEGHFVDVVAGPFRGLWGTYVETATRNPDGSAKSIVVRNRDYDTAPAAALVDYTEVRRSKRNGGR